MTNSDFLVRSRRSLHRIIGDDLLAGRLTTADQLSEHALGARYGVSRTPVREALARLEQDGLIERRGTTARLRERSPQEVHDIYRARSWLEQAIARDAAERRTDLDLLRMQEALAAGEALDTRTSPAADLMAANRLFHDALAEAAHNATLQDLQDRLTRQVARLPETTLRAPGRWTVALEEHRQILDAVRARDAETAGSAAERHLTAAGNIRLALSLRQQA